MDVVIEFIVTVGCMTPQGTVTSIMKVLGNYTPDAKDSIDNDGNIIPARTAFKKLSDEVVALFNAPEYVHIQWISLSFGILSDPTELNLQKTFRPLIVATESKKKDTHLQLLEWFKSIQFFKKLIGSVGGSLSGPVSCGYYDYTKNLRVELENGVIKMESIE